MIVVLPDGRRRIVRTAPPRSPSRPMTHDVPAKRLLASDQANARSQEWRTPDRPSATPSAASRSPSCRPRPTPPARSSSSSSALAPDGHVPGAHVHPEQEERFHVLEGTMKFRMGLRRIVAQAGDTVVVPAGRVHRFANGGDETARCRVEVVPALDMEQLLETTVELALEGNVTRKGHAEAAPPRALRAALRPRGPRAVPARLDGARADGPAGRRRAARARRALRDRDSAPGRRPAERRPGRPSLRAGAARGWCPIRSSKPAGGRSPVVGRFDSCAAPLRCDCRNDFT